jgi:hypothetical protein
LAYGLTLAGAPRLGTSGARTDGSSKGGVIDATASPAPQAGAAGAIRIDAGNEYRSNRAGAANGPRVVNVVSVDWRDDRGTREREAGKLVGPLPFPVDGGNVATGAPPGCVAPACSFNIECDDGNRCTVDLCDIVSGTGTCTGTCTNTPVADGSAGGCSDDDFCNGLETCENLVCHNSTNNGAPCDENSDCTGCPVNPAIAGCCYGVCTDGPDPSCCDTDSCMPDFATCSDESDNAGDPCTVNADCRGGLCNRCQTTCDGPEDCDDDLNCNGVETCSGGFCQRGVNPCGAGGICFEGKCPGAGGDGCNTDADCAPSLCDKTVAFCAFGRCCLPFTDDAGEAAPTCRHTTLNTQGAATGCSTLTNSQWYPGDEGSVNAQEGGSLCGGSDTLNPSTPTDPWGCPKYGRGITMHSASTPPVYPVTVGPVSNVRVPAAGPVAPEGPGGLFYALGDDYELANSSHIGLDVVRFHGGVIAGNRLSMDFYDDDEAFVEDIVLPPLSVGEGIQVVILNPALIVPSKGYVVLRVAEDFSPNTRFVWSATTAPAGPVADEQGINKTNELWVNKGPTNASWLGVPQILAMELVGDKVNPPRGACCNSDTGECDDNVISWICTSNPLNVFHGVDTRCATCTGGQQTGQNCRRCANGNPCNSDLDCQDPGEGGNCVTTASVCTTGGFGYCSAGDVGLPGQPTVCQVGMDDQCDLDGDCDETLVQGTCDCPAQDVVPCDVVNTGECTTGDIGTQCTIDDDCDHAPTNVCIAGNLMAACTIDDNCDVQGVCSAATCDVLQDCAAGSCCNPTQGKCGNTTAGPGSCNGTCVSLVCSGGAFHGTACGSTVDCQGVWQGYGSACDVDPPPTLQGTVVIQGDDATQHCCKQPLAQRCMGGRFNDTACTVAVQGTCGVCPGAQCGVCTAGMTGFPCKADDECDLGNHAACARCVGRCSDNPDDQCDILTCGGGDGAVNDGCPAVGPAETGLCADEIDNDGDGKINDGCPAVGPAEAGAACDNALDDEGDCGLNGLCVGPDAGRECCPTGNCLGGDLGQTCDEATQALADAHCFNAADSNGTCDLVENTCTGGLRNGLPCNTTVDCQVGACEGRCVPRWSGGDDCEDARVYDITVPLPSDNPPYKVITITGDQRRATNSFAHPDEFWGPSTNAVVLEPGWWEAFRIDKCARVRIDLCCTDPIRQPQYSFMVDACQDGAFFTNEPDPSRPGQRDNFRGPPFCPQDNLWQTYGLLPPGTYYHPIFSSIEGAQGQYQMHITVEPCAAAACCYLECENGARDGFSCNSSNSCPGGACQGTFPTSTCNGGVNNGDPCDCPGGTCDSKCDTLNQIECDAKLGFSLQPPQVRDVDGQVNTEVLCTQGTCDIGSCCTGPGECKDARDNSGSPMTKAICETTHDGKFIGNVQCKGGRCQSGTYQGLSCNDSTDGPDCDAVPPDLQACNCDDAHQCIGDRAQVNPCPLCEHIAPDTCQRDPGSFTGTAYLADTSSTVSPTQIADDVKMDESGMLTTVCVIGTYVEFTTPGGGYCGAAAQSTHIDSFTVRVYSTSPGGYTPGAIVGTSATSFDEEVEFTSGGGFSFWRHQLKLTTPIGPLSLGQIYWIQVANNTTGGDPACNWFWLNAADGEGNGLFYQDLCSNYDVNDANVGDISLCMNLRFSTPDTQERACCTGSVTNPCVKNSFEDCEALNGSWQFGQADCSGGFQCPSPDNDSCANAIDVQEGSFAFDMFGSTQDGAASEQCEAATPTMVDGDIWYHYRPTASGTAYIGTCDCEGHPDADEVVSVYATNPPSSTCPCPPAAVLISCQDSDQANHINPDGCDSFGDNAEEVQEVVLGNCYTVRVSNFSSATTGPSRKLPGHLRIALSPAVCGNGMVEPEGGEQCDGPSADGNCDGQCDAYCLCPPPVCGDSILSTPLGEQCDGTATGGSLPCTNFGTTCRGPGDPAGECRCVPNCGNNHLEDGELCDGTQLGPCVACNNLTCQCNVTCGNNQAESGEPCDGTDDDRCPGACGNPGAGDPGTCSGGVCITGDIGQPCTGHGDCTVEACTCPTPRCGNGVIEVGINEECDTGGICDCPGADVVPCDTPGSGTCTSGLVGSACTNDSDCDGCSEGPCRVANDPAGECTCACGSTVPPEDFVWDSNVQQTRSVTGNMVDPSTASGGAGTSAIKVTMIDIQNPNPPNNNPAGPCCPPGNFVTFDTAVNSVCAGGNDQGYRCPPSTCPGSSCPAGVGCTGDPAANPGGVGGCARWVGPPLGYLESNDNPGLGNYRVARLQCTPFYYDWSTEPNNGQVNILGAEIVPSSTFEIRTYGADCKGAETACANVSGPVTVSTRRAGDISTPYQGAPPLTQPNAVDVANAVNKFRNLAGSPPKVVSQVQPNFPDPNADINAIDIVTVVDNQRGFGYTYSGPCVCPSTVPCNTTACAGASACTGLYGAGATCIKTCTSGRTGQPCNNNLNCGYCVGGPATGTGAAGIPCDANGDCASGTCQTGVCPTGATPGFCRDRCGRCN